MAQVVVVGSLNADLVVRVDRFPAAGETVSGADFAVHAGGKGANQACAAARLGARVFMVGRLGRDENARLLRESLEAAGVDLSHVREDPSVPTGTALIEIDATGQNRIVVVPGANGRVEPADIDNAADLVGPGTILLVQLEIPLRAVARALSLAHERGAFVILDPAPVRPDAMSLVRLAHVVTPNESELGALVGEAPAPDHAGARKQARVLLARGAQAVVAKRGAEGAFLVRHDDEHDWPAPRIDAVDTTAAGDAWNGAFAAALAEGQSEKDAGRFATDAAALSVTRAGAQPGMPTRTEVLAWRAALVGYKES
jgi:ribokinase